MNDKSKIKVFKTEREKYSEEMVRLFLMSTGISAILLAIFVMYFKTLF